MNWTYSLERIPDASNNNKHIVRVTSKSRYIGDDIKVRFFTNLDSHEIRVRTETKDSQERKTFSLKVSYFKTFISLLKVSPDNPIKLFAEVKLNCVPVMDARVTVYLTALNQSGSVAPPVSVRLYDRGNGGELYLIQCGWS